MKVLIEDRERSLFLTSEQRWTPFHELAHNFKTTSAAWQACKDRPEPQAVIYVAFTAPSCDVRLNPDLWKHL